MAAAVAAVALLGAQLAAAALPADVQTSTRDVEALAAADGTLWAATRGGLEEYDLATLARRRVYTTADGLTENAVRAVAVEGGRVVARTARAACERRGPRFACAPAPPLPPRAPAAARVFRGARVTAELEVGGVPLVGTAGAGLWRAGAQPRALTPDGQVCGNHGIALARFRGRTFLGTFDEGLCAFDGARFRAVPVPARMINALVATGDALYVATTRGLFVTRDGARFRRVHLADGRRVTDLALDGDVLWAVSPVTLWRVPLGAGRPRGWFLPAGSRALQAVDVRGGAVWLASEDRGAIRFREGRFTIFDRAAGLPSSWSVDVAAADDGGAWVATLRHGLVRIAGDGRSSVVAGLPDSWMLHVSRDASSLWVGTQGGAARVDADGAHALLGLPHPSVHATLVDGGSLWVATEGGLARYRVPADPARSGARQEPVLASAGASGP
jgi:ligand-binding sensor domain-containing protein